MNRQDVIDHLQIIRTWAAVGKDPIYQGIEPKCCEDVEKWIDEALELLKEQEPRVMTLDEAAAADEVWVEMWHGVPIMVAVLYITDDFKNFELELLGRNKKAFMLAKHYGHTWRCWTAKPTEEQRLAVKWDDNQT